MPGLPGDVRGDAGLAEIRDEFGRIVSLVGTQGQLPGRSGGVAVQHVQRGPAFGAAVSAGQVALNNQSVPVSISACPMKHSIAPCREISCRAVRPGH